MALLPSQTGGYAQYATANTQTVLPIPTAINFDQATALFVQGITAWLMLTDASTVDVTKKI